MPIERNSALHTIAAICKPRCQTAPALCRYPLCKYTHTHNSDWRMRPERGGGAAHRDRLCPWQSCTCRSRSARWAPPRPRSAAAARRQPPAGHQLERGTQNVHFLHNNQILYLCPRACRFGSPLSHQTHCGAAATSSDMVLTRLDDAGQCSGCECVHRRQNAICMTGTNIGTGDWRTVCLLSKCVCACCACQAGPFRVVMSRGSSCSIPPVACTNCSPNASAGMALQKNM